MFPIDTARSILEKIFDILEVAQIIPGTFHQKTRADIENLYEKRDFEMLFLRLGDLERFPCFLILRQEVSDAAYFHFLGQALTSEVKWISKCPI